MKLLKQFLDFTYEWRGLLSIAALVISIGALVADLLAKVGAK